MRHLHVLWLTAALAAAAFSVVPVTGLVPAANAREVAPVTDLDVAIRMIGKTDAATAAKIKENFDKIDKSDQTAEQKTEAKIKYLRKRIEKLTELADNSLTSLDGRAIIRENQDAIRFMIGILEDPDEAIGHFLVAANGPKYRETRKEMEEQREAAIREAKAREEAELKKRNDVKLPELSSAGSDGDSGWSVSIGGGIGERQPAKQAFLAREIGGILTFGAVMAERDVTETSWDVALRYAGEFSGFRIAEGANTVIEPSFRHSWGSGSWNLGDFDPGMGVGLGIPGTGDLGSPSPAGFFFPDFAGIGNTVTGIRSRYEFDSYEIGLKLGQELDISPDLSFLPFARVSYEYTSERQRFGGDLPGYLTAFEYDTRIGLDTFKLGLGTRLEYSLSDSFSIFAEPSASLNFISVDGSDGLELSGFVTDSQRVDLDGSETLPGVKLAVGFDWEPEDTPFSIYVGAEVAHEPNTATVHRSGELGEQSEASVKYTTSYALQLELVLLMGGSKDDIDF